VHICKCAFVGLWLSKQHSRLSKQCWRRLKSSKGMGPCWLVHSNCHSGGAVFIQPNKNPEHGGSNISSQQSIISKMTLIFINTRNERNTGNVWSLHKSGQAGEEVHYAGDIGVIGEKHFQYRWVPGPCWIGWPQ